MYRPRTSCSSGSSRRFICERRAASRALSPKSGSFICGCVFANRSPSVAPRRTQARGRADRRARQANASGLRQWPVGLSVRVVLAPVRLEINTALTSKFTFVLKSQF
jgi:hypothetical protein